MRKWVFTAVKEERIKQKELEQREKRAQEIAKKNNLNELKSFYGGGETFMSREYTKEQLNSFVDNIDDIEF